MAQGFEGFAAGVAVVVRLSLHPLATDLAKSALVAAVNYFARAPYIGGQAARGFGWSSCEWATDNIPRPDLYESYLADNADLLRNGLIMGTLGTSVALCQ